MDRLPWVFIFFFANAIIVTAKCYIASFVFLAFFPLKHVFFALSHEAPPLFFHQIFFRPNNNTKTAQFENKTATPLEISGHIRHIDFPNFPPVLRGKIIRRGCEALRCYDNKVVSGKATLCWLFASVHGKSLWQNFPSSARNIRRISTIPASKALWYKVVGFRSSFLAQDVEVGYQERLEPCRPV